MLFIAEKKELAKAIVDALGNASLHTGYYRCGSDIVTWCFGHMLELYEPQDFDPALKFWRLEDLPLFFFPWKKRPIASSKDQFGVIIRLLRDANVVVHAGDPDPEGQLLVDEVLQFADYRGPVKRLLINDNTPAVVRKSLANMRDNDEFAGLSAAAEARQIADKIYGYNMTRLYTLAARREGCPDMLSVGRVQTPILGLVVRRDRENANHERIPYYIVKAAFRQGEKCFTATYRNRPDDPQDADGRLIDQEHAQRIADGLKGKAGKVLSFDVKKGETPPPLPYNLLALQADASRLYGLAPDVVKEVTQSLREKYRLISYNRSDCRYLSDEQHANAPEVVASITMNMPEFVLPLPLDTGIKSRAFNSGKVSAHHAIVPTSGQIDISKLTRNERDIYQLIAQGYLQQFMPNQTWERATGTIDVDGLTFVCNSRITTSNGWRAFSESEPDEQEDADAEPVKFTMIPGQDIVCDSGSCLHKETAPKPLYTMASLLNDLTRVAQYVRDDRLRAALIDKDRGKESEHGGIGTPATRDEILKTLFDRGFIEVCKKGKSITVISTKTGRDFYDILPDDAKYPDLTAIWHEQQLAIERGEITVNTFLDELIAYISNEIARISTEGIGINLESRSCPKCGKPMLKRPGKTGCFWNCSDFPHCAATLPDDGPSSSSQSTEIYQYFKSTGHPSRLERDTFDNVAGYKQENEDLICTVATLTMCAELGIPPQPARNTDLVDSWRQSMVDRPIDFAKNMAIADKAVWTTLQQEHTRNKQLNSQESEVWRPIPEEFPAGAVKTFLDRKEILDAIENAPESLDKFDLEGKEVFSKRETGYLLSKKSLDPDNPESGTALLVKTTGFDRDGNPHDILMSYNIQLDQNGMSERTRPVTAHSVRETEKTMTLPQSWSGKLEVRGCRETADGNVEVSNTPQFYGVFAKTEDNVQELVATFDRQQDAQKYVHQVNRNYEYLGKQRGLDIDFESLKNPDREYSTHQKENNGRRGESGHEVEPTEQTRAECIAAMEAVGMLVTENHPIFDGKGHRIDVEGDKPKENTGWYVAHADGRPAGTCVNNRSNIRADWSKSKGYTLTEGKKRELNGIAQAKKATYQKEKDVTSEQAQARLASMIKSVFTKPKEPTPYLANKELPLDPGIYQNKGSTCIPIHDAEGTIHSMAYVKEDGTKRYAKGAEKEGHFYAYGGMDAIKKADALIICEGYSTAATVSMATGMPTIAAFDSGNIVTVAETLHQLFPGKPIIIAADDDRHLPERTPPERNSGRMDGQKAADKVNGSVVFPRWDKSTPAEKQFKDFDDIRRVHGIESVRSQIMPTVEREVERAKENKQKEQEQEKSRTSLARA